MAEPASGPGDAAARASRRQFWTILGTMFGAGMAGGVLIGVFEVPTDGGFMTGSLPPWVALFAAITTFLAMTLGSWMFFRRIDEFERADNMYAAAVGANVLMMGYPVWFFLAKGGWVSEPHHLALFAILFLTTIVTYLFRKFR